MAGKQINRGPGRPSVPDHQRRKHHKICVTDAVWERWKRAAQRAGISVSQWIESQLERKPK